MYMQSEEYVEDGYDPYAYSYQTSGDYEMHTGDPTRDREYEKSYQTSYIIPDEIRRFLLCFQTMIHERSIFEIQNAYEVGFTALTERFFKSNPWPDAESVASIIRGDDTLFMILYKELYFRHVYARVQSGPTCDQRFESYYNYCNLFNYILNADTPVPLELPNQWLWDIIDEFIYQFQSFSQYRSKMATRSEDDIAFLKQHPKIWNVHSVLNVLHSLVDKSSINEQLEVYATGGLCDSGFLPDSSGDPESVAGEFGRQTLYKMLGYFSLVGLLRLHSLLGDYHQALKVLEKIDLNKKNMYSRVPACQITTNYYVGFAHMMMRRYEEAIRTFSNILLYIQRTKAMFQTKVQLYDQIQKQNDQMYTLLSICLVLHPMRIDESVHSQLREKHGDKMQRMQKGDTTEFESSFLFACPKFLSPVAPNYDAPANASAHKEPLLQQQAVFMDEISQQLSLSTVRSFLKLYTTLPISKLAGLMDMPEEALRVNLMCFKHKMKGYVEGKDETPSTSEVDFYIDKDMIHIADTKVARRYGDFFIRQIHKFEELNRTLKAKPVKKGDN